MPKNLDNTHRDPETGLHNPQEIQDEFRVAMLKLNTMFLEVKTRELEGFQRSLQKLNKDFSRLQKIECCAYLTTAFVLGVLSGVGIMKIILEK